MLLLGTGRTYPRVLKGWTVLDSRSEIKEHINEHLLTNRTESDSESKAWFYPCSPGFAGGLGKRRLAAGAFSRTSFDPDWGVRDVTVRSLSVHTNRIL